MYNIPHMMAHPQSSNGSHSNGINNNNSNNHHHHHINNCRNDVRPPFLTLQCIRCQQRIVCCPGCGTANLILLSSNVSHSNFSPAATAHNSVHHAVMSSGGNNGSAVSLPSDVRAGVEEKRIQMSSHTTPTAFEMFCREAEAQNNIAENRETEEERCNRRRLLAEMWLSADTATRERFETDAAAMAAAAAAAIHTTNTTSNTNSIHTATPSRTRDRRDTRSAKKERVTSYTTMDAAAMDAPNSVGAAETAAVISCEVPSTTGNTGIKLKWNRRRPPTAYGLFCSHHRRRYKNYETMMSVWKMMSLEEKKPYDDEAAAIRVALQN